MHPAVAIARDLISIPSVNPMGTGATGPIFSERNVACYVQNFLRNLGLSAELHGNDETHPNVLAIADFGRTETILLEAHMDTVSHAGMVIEPFDPVIDNGLLYGRGSCDTKSSLAVYLAAAAAILKSGRRPKRNLAIAGVHDEEYSFAGSRELVNARIKATFAIAGEPTGLNIIYAHKGVCRFCMHTRGTAAHAALPWLGESAIYRMADVLREIESHAEELKVHAHPELGPATINVGRIHGGEAVNIVPAQCTIEVDRRLLPEETFQSAHEALKPHLASFTNNLIVDDPYMEARGLYTPTDSIPCRSLQQACQQANWSPQLETAHYATDASILSSAGIPTVVFGPGSIAQAHTKDEFVPVKDIETAFDIILALLNAS